MRKEQMVHHALSQRQGRRPPGAGQAEGADSALPVHESIERVLDVDDVANSYMAPRLRPWICLNDESDDPAFACGAMVHVFRYNDSEGSYDDMCADDVAEYLERFAP